MAKKPPSAKVDPYLNQALMEASMQVDPQADAILSLLAGKRSDYINTRQVNASNARGIAASARQADANVQRFYGAAPDVSSPPPNSLLAALSANRGNPEGDAAYGRALEAAGRAHRDFESQANYANQARVFGNEQARSQYLGDKAELIAGLGSLAKQKGLLSAATYGKLLESRRDRQVQYEGQRATSRNQAASREQSERNSVRSAGLDPDTGLPIPNGPLDPAKSKPKAPKLQTMEQHDQKATLIREMERWARGYKAKGLSRAQVVARLQQPVDSLSVSGKDATGKATGKTVNVKGRDAYNPDIFMSAALDVVFDGHLSRKTQEQLQKDQRYSIRRLGLPPVSAAPNRRSKLPSVRVDPRAGRPG